MKTIASLCIFAAVSATAISAVAAPAYKVVSTIKTEAPGVAQSLTVDQAGRRLYVGRQGVVEVVDVDSGAKVGQVPVAGSVGGVVIAADLGRGFATSMSENAVTVFDIKTLKPITVVKSVGSEPAEIAYDPKTKRVFVSSHKGGKFTAIAADTGEVAGSVDLGGRLRGIALDTRGSVFVADETQNVVHQVDTKTMKLKGDAPTWPASKPIAIALDNKERRVYTATASGRFVVIDPDMGQVVGHASTGTGDVGIAIEFGANRFARMFVPSADGKVTMVQNAKLTASVESVLPSAGIGGVAVAVDAKTGKAYVAGKSEILVLSSK